MNIPELKIALDNLKENAGMGLISADIFGKEECVIVGQVEGHDYMYGVLANLNHLSLGRTLLRNGSSF